ncbi:MULTISPECIES: hypothetical protein [Acinetobacter]|uniref:Uncharacterized protein n=1 Tax=Acinetobacter higginsii TaxID=70347 RepID=N9RDY1_9GAMM|nr:MULTISPECIES: hypothetical protein [Acinetobacter]ENX56174.1 hypothetical protein F902_03271 [Acinetobacter higginsii]
MINFENVPVVAERIKRSNLELQENGFYWTHATDFQSLSDQDYVNSCYYGWQHRQTEVEELQKQVEFLEMNLRFVKEHFEMNDLDKAMPRVYEKLEQALKGGGE